MSLVACILQKTINKNAVFSEKIWKLHPRVEEYFIENEAAQHVTLI